MHIQKIFLFFFSLFFLQPLFATPLQEEFKRVGYIEIWGKKASDETFQGLYSSFDEMIAFLQKNPTWSQKLYRAKERFIRSKERNYYSTDFFGFYDESKARRQISFYYSIHFHEFICSSYPEFQVIPEIMNFLEACYEIQKPYGKLFQEVALNLELDNVFSFKSDDPPLLLKTVKYFPSYHPTRPHYDGTAFSLFLDSTDDQSLLLSPYKSSFLKEDFFSPERKSSERQNESSILLIPGTLLTEFFIYPTPHIVTKSNKIRYATIAFAMRPPYLFQKTEFSSLPNFQ